MQNHTKGDRLRFFLLTVLFAVSFTAPAVSKASSQRLLTSQTDYSTVVREISQEVDEDRAFVKDPKHATRLYVHEKKAQRAVLILHGLYESPYYLQGFAKHFYSKGANVLSLRLPGHMTRNPEDINTVTYRQWVAAVEKAFAQVQQLGEQVEILGYSTGGALGTYLSLKYPRKVKALYQIAPALALSDRVFLASLVLGWTNMDLSKVCTSADSQTLACKMVLHTDEQLEQLLKEGLNPAPAAGMQVQNLLHFIISQFCPSGYAGSQDYYKKLRMTYQKLKVPMVMVNSASDNVVSPDFNNSIMKNYPAAHRNLYFPKSQNISHLMISKSADDAYNNAPETLNPYFDLILENIEALYSGLK